MSRTFRGVAPITTLQVAEADITLAVTTSGSDSSSNGRPARLVKSDYSSTPFGSLPAALDALPKGLSGFQAIVNIGSGSFAGHILSDMSGSENALQLIGTWSAVTATTGLNSGTAGTGTLPTAIKKPTGADDWTADEFDNCFVRVTGGAGYVAGVVNEVFCPILYNDGDTLHLGGLGIPDADNTTQFQIVLPGTILDTESVATYLDQAQGLGFVNCSAEIILRRIKFDLSASAAQYGLFATGNTKLDVSGCWFAGSNHLVQDGNQFLANRNILTDDAYLLTKGISRPTCNNTTIFSARMETQNFGQATFDYMSATQCAGNAFTANGGKSLVLGCDAYDNTATPVVMRACDNMSIGSYGLFGDNSGTYYGLDIGEGGHYFLVGSTLAGSQASQVYLEGRAIDYTSLALYSTTRRFHTTIEWGGSGGERILSRVRIDVEPDNNGNELSCAGEGVFGNTLKMFGAIFSLGNADGEMNAFSPGGQQIPPTTKYQSTRITGFTGGARDHASVTMRFFAVGGTRGHIFNDTDYIIDVYPPNGGTLDGRAMDTPMFLPPKSWMFWKGMTDLDFVTSLVVRDDIDRYRAGVLVDPPADLVQTISSDEGVFPEHISTDGGGKWIVATGSGNRFWASVDDGVTWVETANPGLVFTAMVRYVDGDFWAAGGTQLWKAVVNSDATITFTAALVPAEAIYHMTKKPGYSRNYVIIGAGGHAHYTSDPMTVAWTQGSSVASNAYYDEKHADYQGRFLVRDGGAGGNLHLYISTNNGVTFSDHTASGIGTLSAIYAFGASASRIVVFGDAGKIYSSDNNGSTWTARTSGVSDDFANGDYSEEGGYWIGTTVGGDVVRSVDGATWTFVTVDASANLSNLSLSEDVVVVGDKTNVASTFWVSSDKGLTFTAFADFTTPSVCTTVRAGGRTVVVGDDVGGNSLGSGSLSVELARVVTNAAYPIKGDDRFINTNTGSALKPIFRLPPNPFVGEEHTFYVDDAIGLRIEAIAPHFIRVASAEGAAGGFAESTTVGAMLTLKYRGSNKWISVNVEEVWDVE